MEHNQLNSGPSFALQSEIAPSKTLEQRSKGVPNSLLHILSIFPRNWNAALITLTGTEIVNFFLFFTFIQCIINWEQ